MQDPYDSQLAPIESHYRFYYDCLMKPNAKSVSGNTCALLVAPVQRSRLAKLGRSSWEQS